MKLLGYDVRRGTTVQELARQIKKGLRKAGHRQVEIDTVRVSPFPEGGLMCNFTVVDGGVRTPVYLFLDDWRHAGAPFARALEAAAAEGKPTPVYYAPVALPSVDAPPPPWYLGILPTDPNTLAKGVYAMWWGPPGITGDDPGLRNLSRAYAAMPGVESIVLLRFDAAKPISANMVDRMIENQCPLPEAEEMVAAALPGLPPALLLASREKGIRFCFHVDSTPPADRDRFLAEFADCVEDCKKEYVERGKGLPDKAPSDGSSWWVGVLQMMDRGLTAPVTGNQQLVGGFEI